MDLKTGELAAQMTEAAIRSFGADWPKAKDYARAELKKLAQSLIDIAKLIAAGKVNKQQAQALLQIHRNTTQTVLLTIEGLGVIAVENAINAALGAVATAVNKAAGLALL